jgi:ABC-type polysaccharide/polyol phosphate export permease
MNQDQVTGIIRAVVPALLAYVVGKGWISESSVADITTAAIAVAAAIWSVFNNTTEHKLTSSVAEPGAVEAARAIEPTLHVTSVANALTKEPRK